MVSEGTDELSGSDDLTLHWPMVTKVPLIKFAKCTPNQVS